MIIEKYKAIFVHIPKTAGSSIKHYFRLSRQHSQFFNGYNTHNSIHQIRKSHPDLYKSYKKFSIVRNPYDKMVSWFFYLKKRKAKKLKKVGSELPKANGSLDFVEFNAWVKDFPSFQNAIARLFADTSLNISFSGYDFDGVGPKQYTFKSTLSYMLKPQHTWLDDTVKIIKFENINKELSDFFETKINLPISNKSIHNHYSTYYNRESLDIIYNKYEEDFKKFNYKKQ